MTRRLRELVLWAGAVLGLVAVACGVAVAWFGFSFLVFRSGSMSPEIPTGSLALARTVDGAQLEPGDVVSVVAANGDRITHRVVTATAHGSRTSLVLRGDANEVPDAEVYDVTEAESIVFAVPWLGYVVAYALTPTGLVAVICLTGMLLVLGWSRDDHENGDDGADHDSPADWPGAGRAGRPRADSRLLSGLGVLAGLASLLVGPSVQGTSAAFTDPAQLSGTHTARVLDAPTGVQCTTAGGAYIRWTAPVGPAPTGYRVHWTNDDGGSGTSDVGAGVTQWRPPAPGFLQSVVYTARVSALNGSWSSVQSTTTDTITVSRFIGTSYSC